MLRQRSFWEERQMPRLDRRTLLGATAALPAAAMTGANAAAATQPAQSVDVEVPVTATLAQWLVRYDPAALPPDVQKETARTLLNWVGVAVGGSREPAVNKAIAALTPFSGPPQASIFGRRERMDVLNAALMSGIASHIFDFDDTHLKTIIHPAGPVASALLALAEYRPVSGRDFVAALALGVETECRIGNAVYPEHYAMGWHITGSCGPFGAAAAVGKVLGLDEQRMIYALGLAATQPVGLKIMFGSMTKSLHPGRAAQNGLTAALLAQQGYTTDDAPLEGKDGWGQALSTRHNWHEVVDGLGSRWEALLNTYKPFACGIVTHPAIDAAIQLRDENHLQPDQIDVVELRVHPLVLSLTGKTDPHVGLEGKFSIYHCVAIALITGKAGEKQFSDAAVNDPTAVALRKRVKPIVTEGVKPDQVDMVIKLKDGRTLTKHIDHAVGSTEKPMTDAQLEAKFSDLAEGILPPDQVRKLMDLCWHAGTLADAGDITRAGAARA